MRSFSLFPPESSESEERDGELTTELFVRAGQSGEEGILWHKRVSRFKASEHGGYDVWYDAVGQNHIEQEQEYVDNLVDVVDVGKSEGKKGASARFLLSTSSTAYLRSALVACDGLSS